MVGIIKAPVWDRAGAWAREWVPALVRDALSIRILIPIRIRRADLLVDRLVLVWAVEAARIRRFLISSF